jgi:hypothetical protein
MVGYMMPKLGHADELYRLIQPQQRLRHHPAMNHRYLYRAASNLARAVDALHTKGYVVGDMNERNVLFTNQALISMIDCDSMQVIDQSQQLFTCGVGVPEFLAPELHGKDLALTQRTSNQDNFTLAILIFKLLMQGFHPFQGRPVPGQTSGEQAHLMCMQQRIFPYLVNQTFEPPLVAPAFTVLPAHLQQMFVKAFTTADRPPAREWVRSLAMVEQRLVVCVNDASHVHPSDGRCVLCEIAQNLRTRAVIQTQVALPPPPPPKNRVTKKPAVPITPVVPPPSPTSVVVAAPPPPAPVKPTPVVVPAPSVSLAVAVAAAAQYTVAVRQDGSVAVWGDPAFQRIPTSLGAVQQVYAHQSCIIAVRRDGSIVSWGPRPLVVPNNLPAITHVVVGRQGIFAVTPQQQLITWDQSLQWRIVPIPQVVSVVAGMGHTVTIDRDGNVRAWGDNACGQTNIPMDTPVYRAIYAGHTCTIAMRKNGSLHVVGAPAELHRFPPEAKHATYMVIGAQHAIAVTAQHTLTIWGSGNHPTMRLPTSSVPIDSLALGDTHIVALRRDGKILAWGKNDVGQCDVPVDLH